LSISHEIRHGNEGGVLEWAYNGSDFRFVPCCIASSESKSTVVVTGIAIDATDEFVERWFGN
jgi:hypothetical protein